MPWPRPTVVVDLPSPSGVGVMAVTRMYLAFGRSLSLSMDSSFTLAMFLPYSSISSRVSPIFSAMASIGSIVAACAISMSLGTGLDEVMDALP